MGENADFTAITELVEWFEELSIDLNAYWSDPGVQQITDGAIRGKVKSLCYYLRAIELFGLASEVEGLERFPFQFAAGV